MKRKLKKLLKEFDILFACDHFTARNKCGIFFIRKSKIGLLNSLLRGLIDKNFRKYDINYGQAVKLWDEMLKNIEELKNE